MTTPLTPRERVDAFYREHPICEYEDMAHPADCDAWLDFARQLAAECEALREDAERYLHVRNASVKTGSLNVHQRVYDGYHHALVGEELDAAIDAARKETP